MDNILKCIGIVCLVLFSFFYTFKSISFSSEKDPIMKSIISVSRNDTNKCSEGTLTNEGAILGVSGREVNINKSYSNMKGIGFSEELLVFDEYECEVTMESTVDTYIIGGNKVKNSVSLLVLVNDGSLIEDFVKISEEKNIKFSFIVNGSTLETNMEFFKKVSDMSYDILYNGTDEVDLKKYRQIMKSFSDNKGYCVYSENNDILKLCSEYNINSIRTNNVF